ncbi:MAG: YbhB/YbcL family Raf kinase inhibitor-like protein [Nitrospirota bacterium]
MEHTTSTHYKALHFAAAIFVFFLIATALSKEDSAMAELKLSSPVFKDNSPIPSKYTCDGNDVNPPLVIENVPSNAKSLVLIVDDPDAPMGTWVHWVVWNIEPKTKEIKEHSLPKGAIQGINDFKKHDYGGPCPPSGTHRYFFKLYALDATLNLPSSARKADVEKAMKGHIISQGQLVGLYSKK